MKVHMMVLFLGLISVLSAHQYQIKQYPYSDSYFDKTYTLRNSKQTRYLHVYCKQANMVSLSITDTLHFEEHPRFPIFPHGSQPPKMQQKYYTFFDACQIDVRLSKNSILEVVRLPQNHTIFSLKNLKFQAADHFEVETEDSSVKWGMGQRFQKKFRMTDGIWTVWNRDRPWEIDEGKHGRSGQTYGHQPVYLAREKKNNFHLLYYKNTHGFNLQLTNDANNLKYICTGGHVQFIIMLGDKNPETLIKRYHQYIGGAHVPPFWALGYHQSRWGYKNIREFENIIKSFEEYSLPLDTMWSDLDYMKNMAIFTNDEINYPPHKLTKLLEDHKLHYIPLIDAGVSLNDRPSITSGVQMNVFMKNSKHQDYEANVWPGQVHFVDFLHPNASQYWENQLARLYKVLPFSGIWLDMNQPSNFQGNEHALESYRIQFSESINMMTMNVNLEHHSQNASHTLEHKQVHAYYGHLSTIPTFSFLEKHGRPFIVSRSNSVGSGAYAAHWTGDNVATWDFLRLSISGNFLFQIFGVQMVGADICGFHKNTNEELCSRWMQLGSLYPFARNHNENQSNPQEPFLLGNQVLETSKISLEQRYSLLKQFYTTMVSVNGTGTFFRPIIFQFFDDQQAYAEKFVQTEFLIGDYLLAAPIVESKQEKRNVYFPGERQIWYQLKYTNQNLFDNTKKANVYTGSNSEFIENGLPAPPPIFLRGGKLIFTNTPKKRSADLDSHFTLVAGLKHGKARGQILAISNYSSESEVSSCINKGCTLVVTIQKKSSSAFTLKWIYEGTAPFSSQISIEKVRIMDERNDWKTHISPITITKSTGQENLAVTQI